MYCSVTVIIRLPLSRPLSLSLCGPVGSLYNSAEVKDGSVQLFFFFFHCCLAIKRLFTQSGAIQL